MYEPEGVLHRECHLGRHRSQTNLQLRCNLQWTAVVLARRRGGAHYCMAVCQEESDEYMAVYPCAFDFGRIGIPASSDDVYLLVRLLSLLPVLFLTKKEA